MHGEGKRTGPTIARTALVMKTVRTALKPSLGEYEIHLVVWWPFMLKQI
jgi:hypothetical protein